MCNWIGFNIPNTMFHRFFEESNIKFENLLNIVELYIEFKFFSIFKELNIEKNIKFFGNDECSNYTQNKCRCSF